MRKLASLDLLVEKNSNLLTGYGPSAGSRSMTPGPLPIGRRRNMNPVLHPVRSAATPKPPAPGGSIQTSSMTPSAGG